MSSSLSSFWFSWLPASLSYPLSSLPSSSLFFVLRLIQFLCFLKLLFIFISMILIRQGKIIDSSARISPAFHFSGVYYYSLENCKLPIWAKGISSEIGTFGLKQVSSGGQRRGGTKSRVRLLRTRGSDRRLKGLVDMKGQRGLWPPNGGQRTGLSQTMDHMDDDAICRERDNNDDGTS